MHSMRAQPTACNRSIRTAKNIGARTVAVVIELSSSAENELPIVNRRIWKAEQSTPNQIDSEAVRKHSEYGLLLVRADSRVEL